MLNETDLLIEIWEGDTIPSKGEGSKGENVLDSVIERRSPPNGTS